jgi:hypothetical protein
MSGLRLKLADGTEVQGTVEGAISGQLRDLLATGYAGNKMRIAADETDDVEGHALATTIRIRLYDEDDVEGHALSLRLASADAARDLQRKLLAAGVVGVIVVGAATATMVVPDLGTSAPAASSVTVPAPDVAPGLAAEIAAGDLTQARVIPAPDRAPGLAAEIAAGDLAKAPPAPAWVDPKVRDATPDETIQRAAVPAPPSADPAVRDRDGGPERAVTPDDPADDLVGRSGEPRAQ